MEHLKMHSPNLVDQNIDRLAELFPDCVTEARDDDGNLRKAIDFDQLRQQLSRHIVDGPQERYQLNWPGKREALLTANAPIAKTLRPCRDESVNFDRTENLFIEGDNLDALKLLQETYLGKVKMIYIDPPYNTGNDFIYNDDFAEDLDSYTQRSNQKDEDGNRLVANTEANGRFHSDWLSMMYSRLKLARNLLTTDGVIFISIDDSEQPTLRSMCNEVFGEKNFISNVVWQKKFSRANDAAYFSTMHDHILCYAKSSRLTDPVNGWILNLLPRGEETPSGYANHDDDPRGIWTSVVLSAKSGTEALRYEIETPSGRVCTPPDGRFWSVNKTKFQQLNADNRIWFGKKGDGTPRLKTFLSEVQAGLRPNSLWLHQDAGHNQEGRQEVKKLFDDKGYFDSPKPVRLMEHILKITSSEKDFTVMDFFAGSGTTAHATMKLNAQDGGSRKFIAVQIPETTDIKSKAFTDGYTHISDITKERIRRAGANIRQQNSTPVDTGFRVLKIDSSNMADIYYRPDALSQADLLDQVDNVKADRTEEDLLFQVMLDWGVELTLPIRRETIDGKTVFFVADNALVACFDTNGGITDAFARQLATCQPKRLLFRDSGFAADSTRINVEQALQQLSPDTDVKSI